MRILALNWRDIRSPEAGGAELHLHEILTRLQRRGHEITLVCSQFARSKGPLEEIVDGIRILRVGAWWNAHVTVPKVARQLLGGERFDLVLDDVNKIPFYAPTWSPVPVVAIFLHLLGHTVFLEANPALAAVLWLYERRAGRVYRDTPSIAISNSTASELVQRGLGPARVSIVECGLNHQSYRRRPEIPKARTPLLLVVSRLKKYKRVDVAVRALARVRDVYPEARLAIIGDGGHRGALERLARRLGQPVTFLGGLEEAKKVWWMNHATLTLNPSAKEGWGLVAVESMACGTPVVASDVPGHRDSVLPGAGILVPYGPSRPMAEATLRLLGDQELYQRLRRGGRRRVAKLTWQRTAEACEQIFLQAAGQLSHVRLDRRAREFEEVVR